MGTPEFPDLGNHCSFDSCRLIDFLPFKCDKCHEIFCLEHRTYTSHVCPNATAGSASVIICPICAKSIRLLATEDANLVWSRHSTDSGCDPANYAKVTKKKKCPVKGCKENLTFSNTVKCRDCLQDTCLKHRFGPDHICPGKKANNLSSSFFGEKFLQNFQKAVGVSAPTNSNSVSNSGTKNASGNRQIGNLGNIKSTNSTTNSKKPSISSSSNNPIGTNSLQNDPSNTLRGSASRRQTEWDKQRRDALSFAARQRIPVTNGAASESVRERAGERGGERGREGGGGGGGGGTEQCPQCSMQFRSVSELIMHVDSEHLGGVEGGGPRAEGGFGFSNDREAGGGGGRSGREREVCPRCGKVFTDIVTLVAHAEAEHGSDRSKCAVS